MAGAKEPKKQYKMETVTNILVPTKDQVNAESQTIFNQLESQLGFVPNMYATIGYSSNALSNILSFSGEAGKGTFSKREIEAIKLAVFDEKALIDFVAVITAVTFTNYVHGLTQIPVDFPEVG